MIALEMYWNYSLGVGLQKKAKPVGPLEATEDAAFTSSSCAWTGALATGISEEVVGGLTSSWTALKTPRF